MDTSFAGGAGFALTALEGPTRARGGFDACVSAPVATASSASLSEACRSLNLAITSAADGPAEAPLDAGLAAAVPGTALARLLRRKCPEEEPPSPPLSCAADGRRFPNLGGWPGTGPPAFPAFPVQVGLHA